MTNDPESMKVTELVVALADLIDRSPLRRSPMQQQKIAHLKSMPEYSERRHLDDWDGDLPESSSEDDPVTADLLEAVFELGRFNLYTMFDRRGTLREYASVRDKFLAAKLNPPKVDRITDW